jgi:hypothetical protein
MLNEIRFILGLFEFSNKLHELDDIYDKDGHLLGIFNVLKTYERNIYQSDEKKIHQEMSKHKLFKIENDVLMHKLLLENNDIPDEIKRQYAFTYSAATYLEHRCVKYLKKHKEIRETITWFKRVFEKIYG